MKIRPQDQRRTFASFAGEPQEVPQLQLFCERGGQGGVQADVAHFRGDGGVEKERSLAFVWRSQREDGEDFHCAANPAAHHFSGSTAENPSVSSRISIITTTSPVKLLQSR